MNRLLIHDKIPLKIRKYFIPLTWIVMYNVNLVLRGRNWCFDAVLLRIFRNKLRAVSMNKAIFSMCMRSVDHFLGRQELKRWISILHFLCPIIQVEYNPTSSFAFAVTLPASSFKQIFVFKSESVCIHYSSLGVSTTNISISKLANDYPFAKLWTTSCFRGKICFKIDLYCYRT